VGRGISPEFAIEVAVSKYADHLPLERQARIMRREGLLVDSQTLWDQRATVADVLRPTYDGLGQYVLQAPIVGADETWWRLMERPAAKRWWVWSVTREDAVVYRILEHRSQRAGREVLAGFTGVVVADGYGAYDALVRAGPGAASRSLTAGRMYGESSSSGGALSGAVPVNARSHRPAVRRRA